MRCNQVLHLAQSCPKQFRGQTVFDAQAALIETSIEFLNSTKKDLAVVLSSWKPIA